MAPQAPPASVILKVLPALQWVIPRWIHLFTVNPGLELTSWFRDVDANRLARGDEDSQHLFALAIDVTSGNLDQLLADARQLGLHAVDEMDHVHVQTFPAGFLRSRGLFV